MFKINIYTVKPLNSRKENISLIIIFIAIITLAGTILKIRHTSHYAQQIKTDEISAFKELNSIELSIYSDLRNSSTEIHLLKDELNRFPSVEELSDEEIAPFHKDITWKEKGAIEWISFPHDESYIYIGFSDDKKVGNFFMELKNQKNEQVNIYYTTENFSKDNIANNFEKYEPLFRKIIPYTGEDERKKFKEE